MYIFIYIYINNDNNDKIDRCADIASHTFCTCPTYIYLYIKWWWNNIQLKKGENALLPGLLLCLSITFWCSGTILVYIWCCATACGHCIGFLVVFVACWPCAISIMCSACIVITLILCYRQYFVYFQRGHWMCVGKNVTTLQHLRLHVCMVWICIYVYIYIHRCVRMCDEY